MTKTEAQDLINMMDKLKSSLVDIAAGNGLETQVEAGDGYYFVPKIEILEKDDEFWGLNRWINTHDAGAPNFSSLVYRRKIPIPDGFERVKKGDNLLKDETYQVWSEKNVFEKMDVQLDLIGFDMLDIFLIRPIKKAYGENWYMEGEILLHGDGTIAGYGNNNKYVLRGRAFNTQKEAEAYSAWELKDARRLRHLQILETRIAELNDGWIPDFQVKWCFAVEFGKIVFNQCESVIKQSLTVYFKSREIGKSLLVELGETFIRIALGYPEK